MRKLVLAHTSQEIFITQSQVNRFVYFMNSILSIFRVGFQNFLYFFQFEFPQNICLYKKWKEVEETKHEKQTIL